MRHHDNNERLVTKVIMSTKSGSETEKLISVDEELKLFYKGAFDDFDWNKNGRIACGVKIMTRYEDIFLKCFSQDLQYAMRRAGQNPTESETQDMVNKIDDGSSSLNFEVKKKYLNVEGNNINCLFTS